MGLLHKFEAQAGGAVDTGLDEEQNMSRAGGNESRARRHCPEAPSVARTSAVTAKAAKTEQLLEKAWRMFQENEQREKDTKQEDWERDDWMSDILTEVQLLGRARHAAHEHFDKVEAALSRGETGSDGEYTDGDFDAELDADELDELDDADSLALSKPPSETGSRVSRASVASTVTSVMEEIDATALRKNLGQYFRSTMVHITNATDVKLHLKTRKIVSGSWYEGCAPPTTIQPHTEVIFASTSRSKWVGGTEAEVAYDTRGEGVGLPSEFRLRWVNGIVAGDKGRYCEAEVTKTTEKSRGPDSIMAAAAGNAAQGQSDTYFVAKDDDDQEENSEVYFTVTSQKAADDHASQFGEGSYIQPRTGSSVSAHETVKAGALEKRRPDGLGFFWQRRWFVLTKSRLRYYKRSADTRAHAQLGQLALKEVIAVQLDKDSTEFVIGAPPTPALSISISAAATLTPRPMFAWGSDCKLAACAVHTQGGVRGGSAGVGAGNRDARAPDPPDARGRREGKHWGGGRYGDDDAEGRSAAGHRGGRRGAVSGRLRVHGNRPRVFAGCRRCGVLGGATASRACASAGADGAAAAADGDP